MATCSSADNVSGFGVRAHFRAVSTCQCSTVRFSRGMIRWKSVGPLRNIEGRYQMVILCKKQDDIIVIYINLYIYMYLLFSRVDLNQSSRKQDSFDHRRRKSLG